MGNGQSAMAETSAIGNRNGQSAIAHRQIHLAIDQSAIDGWPIGESAIDGGLIGNRQITK
jgi:hypothetical protein